MGVVSVYGLGVKGVECGAGFPCSHRGGSGEEHYPILRIFSDIFDSKCCDSVIRSVCLWAGLLQK